MSAYYLSLLTPKDFPEGFRDIVNLIGVKSAYKICDTFGGNPLYIPKTDCINKRLRDLSI